MAHKDQLVLVKRLFAEASGYVDTGVTDPVASGLAISLLQDAVELYTWTLCKAKSVPLTKLDTIGLVSQLEAVKNFGITMPGVAALQDLNKARVGFKHNGNLPHPPEALKHRASVEALLREAMCDHFAVDFDSLSMVDLIENDDIRGHLKDAEVSLAADRIAEAAIALAKVRILAFGLMRDLSPPAPDLSRADGALQGGGRVKAFKPLPTT